MIACVLGFHPFQQADNQTTQTTRALYNSLSRVSWSMALAWIIFSCQQGRGNVVNWFLSLPQFKPFGKMGLSIYLSHIAMQVMFVGYQKTTGVFNNFQNVS